MRIVHLANLSTQYGFTQFLACLLILLLASSPLMAQPNEIDSLKAVLQNELDALAKTQTLNKLAFSLRERDLSEALQYAMEAERIASERYDSLNLAKAKGNAGWIYYRMGTWEKAFVNSRDAYQIARSQGDRLEMAMALNNLGAMYYQQQDFKRAIISFKEAYEIAMELGDRYSTIRSLNNISFNYFNDHQLDSAKLFAELALKLNKNLKNTYLGTFAQRVIADISMEEGNVKQAITSYENILEQVKGLNLTSFESSILHRLGKGYLIEGDYPKAKQTLQKGLDIAIKNNLKDETAQAYKNLAALEGKANNTEAAYQYLTEYIELRQNLDREQDINRTRLLQAMFEVDKAEAELALLRSQSDLNETKLQNSRFVSIIVGVSLVVLIVLLFRAFYLNKNAALANERLLQEQKVSLAQKQTLEQRSAELTTANNTKNLLFSILAHDLRSPVANLQSVMAMLQSQHLSKEEFENLSSELKKGVDGMYLNLDNMLSWSRSQLEGFQVKLYDFKVLEQVQPCVDLFTQVANAKDIKIEIDIDPNKTFKGDKDLFQVSIRNLINNAIKYSNPGGAIRIFIQDTKGQKSLVIQDNGMGIPAEKVALINQKETYVIKSSLGTQREKGTGLGLSVSKSLIAQMNGTLHLESEEGVGTKAMINFER